MSPVAYFDSLGLFDVPVTAAHCVWVDEADLDILQAHGVFVANNPASNMKLGSGFAPIPEMLRRGIPVCLGSDGMASNNNHNLFHDMYLQALIYKGATLDPTGGHAPAGAGGGDAHRRAFSGPRGLRCGGGRRPC